MAGWLPSPSNRLRAESRRGALTALVSLLLVLGALGTTHAQTTLVSVENSAPTVSSVSLPSSSFSPTSGTTTSVTTTIVVADLNGCSDLSSVTLEVLKPDGSSHIAPSNATYVSCSTGTSATYSKSFSMNFYDAAALSLSTYKIKVVATDSQGATGDNVASLTTFNYAQLTALTTDSATLDLGSLNPGASSSIAALGVQNYGNVVIDVQLSGTNLSHASEAAWISVGNISYSTASDMTGSSALSSSATTLSTFDLAAGASSSKSTYWQIAVPSGSAQWVPSGDYTGTITVSATAG